MREGARRFGSAVILSLARTSKQQAARGIARSRLRSLVSGPFRSGRGRVPCFALRAASSTNVKAVHLPRYLKRGHDSTPLRMKRSCRAPP